MIQREKVQVTKTLRNTNAEKKFPNIRSPPLPSNWRPACRHLWKPLVYSSLTVCFSSNWVNTWLWQGVEKLKSTYWEMLASRTPGRSRACALPGFEVPDSLASSPPGTFGGSCLLLDQNGCGWWHKRYLKLFFMFWYLFDVPKHCLIEAAFQEEGACISASYWVTSLHQDQARIVDWGVEWKS